MSTIEFTHPGKILLEIIEEMGISQSELSRRTGIPASRITEVIKGRRSITVEYSVRLGRFFGQSECFWLNMQNEYDVRRVKSAKGAAIEREVIPINTAA